jgi:hypothetical protein
MAIGAAAGARLSTAIVARCYVGVGGHRAVVESPCPWCPGPPVRQAASAARFLRAVTGSVRSAAGKNGMNASGSGSMPEWSASPAAGSPANRRSFSPIRATIGAYASALRAA